MKLEDLTPEEKVALMVDMVDTCLRICAEGIRNRENVTNDEELRERLRARLESNKRRGLDFGTI
ncbi:MAG: hypothetical protein ACOC6H_01065 [Thermoproteota archaeon]